MPRPAVGTREPLQVQVMTRFRFPTPRPEAAYLKDSRADRDTVPGMDVSEENGNKLLARRRRIT